MDNTSLAAQLKLLSKLLEIHGENAFKARSYSNAAFQIERLMPALSTMDEKAIFQIKGIGEAIGKKIIHILQTGHFPLLEQYLENTPAGILEMMKIKGLGPKKIAVIWKELGIENLGELLYACNENRLMLYKGFGAKTQESIRQAIEFFMASKGQFLYQELEEYALQLVQYWKTVLPKDVRLSLTEGIRRQSNTLDKVAIVVSCTKEEIKARRRQGVEIIEEKEEYIILNDKNIQIKIWCCQKENFGSVLFHSTGNQDFLNSFYDKYPMTRSEVYTTEEDLFQTTGLQIIPPCLRENKEQLAAIEQHGLPQLIQPLDIKGIIHAHSSWSDGKNTLNEMALAAKKQGFEYLVISDHSQSAGYANGLKPDRIKAQHEQIDELNEKLKPFRIFKSIESDILGDGSLDYDPAILSTFDLVIASVHSNLKMDQPKAMQRLLTAIENPFTTILGHPTGRLLLSRPGYPVDQEQFIDACVKHQVVIEINAHPRRLDLDWTWIPYALKQGAMFSIDPDAHSITGMADIRYGVLSAQKGGLIANRNLSSFSLAEFEMFLNKKYVFSHLK